MGPLKEPPVGSPLVVMVGGRLKGLVLSLLAFTAGAVVIHLHFQTTARYDYPAPHLSAGPVQLADSSSSSSSLPNPVPYSEGLGRCGPIREGSEHVNVGRTFHVMRGNRSADTCRRLCLSMANCTAWTSNMHTCKLHREGARIAADPSAVASGTCRPTEVWEEAVPPTGEINCDLNPTPTPGTTDPGTHTLAWNESQLQLPRADRKAVCESLRPVAKDRLLVVIATNKAFVTLAKSCLCNLLSVGRSESVLLSLDPMVFEELTQEGYPSFPNPAGFPGTEVARYRTRYYALITLLKFRGVYYLLRWGYRVLFSDSDVAYFSDPLPHVPMNVSLAFTIDDPIVSMDQVTANCRAPAPVWKKLGWACTGIYYAHDSPTTRHIFEWADALALATIMRKRTSRKVLVHDQVGVNMAMRGVTEEMLDDITSFNRCLFSNGNFYFQMRIPQYFNVTPIAVHANYMTANHKWGALKKLRWMENCTKTPLRNQHNLLSSVHRHFNYTSTFSVLHWLADLSTSARQQKLPIYYLAMDILMKETWG
eukprot:Sspe_Gene.40439::Locus_19529_Transcript_1_4_Confidence_0.429_Length_2394::g.40439::m.40439